MGRKEYNRKGPEWRKEALWLTREAIVNAGEVEWEERSIIGRDLNGVRKPYG